MTELLDWSVSCVVVFVIKLTLQLCVHVQCVLLCVFSCSEFLWFRRNVSYQYIVCVTIRHPCLSTSVLSHICCLTCV